MGFPRRLTDRHDGDIEHLPIQVRGRKVDLFPPEPFVAFLDTLGHDDGR